MTNPFTEQIEDINYFVGRDKLLNDFRAYLRGLKDGRANHQYVAGLHGTGKTHYLYKLAEMASEEKFTEMSENSRITQELQQLYNKTLVTLKTPAISENDKQKACKELYDFIDKLLVEP